MDLQPDARLHQLIGILAVHLEGAGGIDQDLGRALVELRHHIAVPVEMQRLQRRGSAELAAESLRLLVGPAGQQLGEPAAEIAITAEDHYPSHARNRSAYRASAK